MRKKTSSTRYPGVSRIAPGRYRIRAKVTDPRTGKVREIDRGVTAVSPKQAAAIREDVRHRARALAAGHEPAARARLGPAAISWLASKAPALKPSTRRLYADTLDLHIIPALGELFVDAITSRDVVAWRDSQHAKPVTINGRLRILKQLLGDVCYELELRSRAERVSSLRVSRRRTPKGLAPDELRLVLSVLERDHPQWYPLALTLALTGARWGEVTALRWTDLDEQRQLIRIERAHVRARIDTTKTDIVKEVPLVPELLSVLKAHRRALLERQAPGLSAGWVFPSRVGTLMQPSALRRPLALACASAGVRRISPHGLRYSFNHAAKRIAERDVVRAITGHVTDEMTTHYDWIDDDEKRGAVARIAHLVCTAESPEGEGSGDAGGDTSTQRKTAGEAITSSGRNH